MWCVKQFRKLWRRLPLWVRLPHLPHSPKITMKFEKTGNNTANIHIYADELFSHTVPVITFGKKFINLLKNLEI